ncbi:carbonic anhydrase [Solidesulfovibrio carbinoliphilus subsp. oakridgensis]|uniref:Carbonic anhydrase n=1 Tax=Solidesulfovibrio carbinoliphilus subsp. oakridgensis TaxID=694327 RepID=G7Q5U4_9BACT|nr:carbonic anhydrase [Solidesulfovibrio carbinoliphilus]EHJ46881.1 carbonic anhydrase [Solidesulfovibrio carbinoliphilus subsp. oakridgensis]
MKRFLAATATMAFLLAMCTAVLASSGGSEVSADEALSRLKEGNTRFVSQANVAPHQDAARRHETATGGQHPFATVLSCADSRAPVEVLFDQGVGDLFVVRVAGNVAATDEIGTIEYGAEHLGVPLVVVLAHTKCGAVTAVVKNEPVTENIGKLVAPIVPAVKGIKARFAASDVNEIISRSIEANMWQAISDIYAKSPMLKKMAADGKIKVVGALYDIDSGEVRWFGEHPSEGSLLDN